MGTERRLLVARAGRREECGCLMAYGGFFGGDENVLELDSVDGCTTLRMYQMPLN